MTWCNSGTASPSTDTYELQRTLEELFCRTILNVSRYPSPYSSSFPIEELEVAFEDGGNGTAIFKNVGPAAILIDASRVKPVFRYDPQREIQVYQSILSSLNLGTPKLYGAVVDPAVGRYWLFLERVAGSQLCWIGEFETWLDAARWLAQFHSSAICDPVPARMVAPCLFEHDANFYWQCLKRAHASLGTVLDELAVHYDRVIELLIALPRALIHGDFYASNILIDSSSSDVRVCPVDWEMAAIGPAIWDVAALASGKWTREQRLHIAQAYYFTLPVGLRSTDFTTAFDCCQLQIALQWLGCADSWSAPEDHAHDWLADALDLIAGDSLSRLLA